MNPRAAPEAKQFELYHHHVLPDSSQFSLPLLTQKNSMSSKSTPTTFSETFTELDKGLQDASSSAHTCRPFKIHLYRVSDFDTIGYSSLFMYASRLDTITRSELIEDELYLDVVERGDARKAIEEYGRAAASQLETYDPNAENSNWKPVYVGSKDTFQVRGSSKPKRGPMDDTTGNAKEGYRLIACLVDSRVPGSHDTWTLKS